MKKPMVDYVRRGKYDELYTPENAVKPLLKYLPKDKIYWECTDYGNSKITSVLRENGFKVISTHKNTFDFLSDDPDFHFDILTSSFSLFIQTCPYICRYTMKGTMSIGTFAKRVGLSPSTIRRYMKSGYITPLKTPKGRYRFTEEHIKQVFQLKEKNTKRITVIYARVSTYKQKNYLESQIELCKQFCTSNGMAIDEIISDVGSSFNFKRKGLQRLMEKVISYEIDTVVVYSKDRLSRIAFDLIEELFRCFGVEIVVIDNSDRLTNDEQLKDAVEEMISFIHYITSKIYGSRSYKVRKIEKCIKEVVANVNSNSGNNNN